jgi:hypothetical protein
VRRLAALARLTSEVQTALAQLRAYSAAAQSEISRLQALAADHVRRREVGSMREEAKTDAARSEAASLLRRQETRKVHCGLQAVAKLVHILAVNIQWVSATRTCTSFVQMFEERPLDEA